MSLSLIRAAIKAKIETVVTANIGTVYDYKRFCNDLATYKELFIRDSKVNTWEIERDAFSRIERGGAGGIEVPTHNFIIRGFFSVYDALGSDKVFQDDYVEPVCQQLMNDPRLSNTVDIITMPITGTIRMGKLGDVLVHICEIRLSVIERRIF